MTSTADDARYMARALELAKRGLNETDPNPRVGSVIVKDGQIIGEGWHRKAGGPHAEIEALNDSGEEHIYGATVYVSLEPCCHHGKTPPCTETLLKAGPGRVVVAMSDPNPEVAGKGIKQLQDAGIPVTVGLMEQEARDVNPGFVSRMERNRPYVRVKLAASLDGRTGLEHGESKWITGEHARRDVHHWRARASAILTGVSTVLHDDPSMNVRDAKTERQPWRVILDSQLKMPADAHMLSLPGKTLIICREEEKTKADALRAAGAEVIALSHDHQSIDLEALMHHLAAREINEVHVEAGATLCGALMQARLVDELVLYLAPHLLGTTARGMFSLPALEAMSDRIALDIKDVRAVGRDWRFVCQVLDS